MTADPYRVAGPCLISFSGGRTSAFMLFQVLQAYDGKLPDDVVVCFANTGREREETLRFVHECGSRWNVRVHWLEWINADPCFEEVGFNSASRDGRPFADLIARKKYLPNVVARFCTQELKIRVMRDFGRSLGWTEWRNAVGLRYDEGLRVMKALARNDAGKERFTAIMPLSNARVTRRDVGRFWLGDNADPAALTAPLPQGFDLGLRDYEGNCDLCFLKGRAKIAAVMRDRPDLAEWWIDRETIGRFSSRFDYASVLQEVRDQGHFFEPVDDDDHDVECGLICDPLERETA